MRSINKEAAEKLDLATYKEGLRLWFRFITLAEAEVGTWSELALMTKPALGELEDDWLNRLWVVMQPRREFPVMVNNGPDDIDWDGVFRELNITINLEFFSKAEILEAVRTELDARMGKSTRGRPDRVRQRAVFQPNCKMTIAEVKLLTDTLKVLESTATTEQAIGLAVWADEEGLDADTAKGRARLYLQRGQNILRGVREGKFPLYDRPPNGYDDE